MCVDAFICTFKDDICSLDTYHLIILAAHIQISHKNLTFLCWFIFGLFDFSGIFFLVLEYTLLCVLPCVRLHKNLCVHILAERYGCAQTTLCVNSSLAAGGRTPMRVCLCVC